MAVARARRRLGMVLHRKRRAIGHFETAIRTVEQRTMGFPCIGGQTSRIDRETMVHRHDLDLAGGKVLHRVIGAVMALAHFLSLGADRERKHLMAEADPEGW